MTHPYLPPRRYLLPWVVAWGLFPCSPAVAEATPGLSDLTWSVGPRLEHFHYRERDTDGNQLNREKGTLQGIQASLAYTVGTMEITASASRVSGRVVYQGRTQAGRSLSTDTEEGTTHYRLSAYLPGWSSDRLHLSPYLAARYSIWNRVILPTSRTLSLTETYRWWTLSAGARVCSGPSAMPGILCLQAGLSQTTNGDITVNLEQLGRGKPVLDLGEDNGGEIALEWHNRRYLVRFYYQEWQFAASNSKRISSGPVILSIQEPASKTRITGLTGGLRF